MKDLEREQANARGGLMLSLCVAALAVLSQGADWPTSDRWLDVDIVVIAGCLLMAPVYAMQVRLLKKAEDGVTAQAYLSIGRTRPPPSWPLRVAMLIALLLIVWLLVRSGFDPDTAPWWVFAAFVVTLVWGMALEVRRLLAMARPQGNDDGTGSASQAETKGIVDS